MDTSRKYMLMCKRAEEIQKLWSYSTRNSGDWYFNEKLNNIYVVSDYEQDDNLCVWIPRQDQLQVIYAEWCDDGELIKSMNWAMVVLDDFQEWVLEDALNWAIHLDTLEQYWLGFVMSKVFNKKWEVGKWEQI